MRIIELYNHKKLINVRLYFPTVINIKGQGNIYYEKIDKYGYYSDVHIVMKEYKNINKRIYQLIESGNNTKSLNSSILVIIRNSNDKNFFGHSYVMVDDYVYENIPSKIAIDGAEAFLREIEINSDENIIKKIDLLINLVGNDIMVINILNSIKESYINTNIIKASDMKWMNQIKEKYGK